MSDYENEGEGKICEDGRHYEIRGKIYIRVSEVVSIKPKPWLDEWKKRIGEEAANIMTEETARIGGKIHDVTMWSDYDREDKVTSMIEMNPWLVSFLLGWREWVSKYIKKWIAIEKVVWSEKMMCAGRIDRIGIIKGDRQPSTIDIKTGSLYDDIGLQLALYKIMNNEKEKTKIQRTIAVNIPMFGCEEYQRIVKRVNNMIRIKGEGKEIRVKWEEPGEIRVKEYTSKNSEKEARKLVKEYQKMFGTK